ncbi:MAG: ung [Gammaproteobacteria bacterium]|jgi:uracil-DNA glycosylase|nr:ung [Gammaproteobacteria bacterium]
MQLNLKPVHPSWQHAFQTALKALPAGYLQLLENETDWLPGHDQIFNAFSLPKTAVRYVLFGESPYPRAASANGYAFWDNAVEELWSTTGFSKRVNRATSLRNWLKMLLVADGALNLNNVSQEAIAKLDKSSYVSTLPEVFANFLKEGFLLLNASLVLKPLEPVAETAKAWRPFLEVILEELLDLHPTPQLLLFGNIAAQIQKLPVHQHFPQLQAPHPYNLSFIQSDKVLTLFKKLSILCKK